MLLKNLALAAIAAFAPTVLADDNEQSVFVTDDQALAFAITIPDHNKDVSFALRVSKSYSWGAVGLGVPSMAGALHLIIYRSYDDKGNVTLSPRLASSNTEPYYFPDVKWDQLEGTGVGDDYYTYAATCTEECRNWPRKGGDRGGYMDVSSSSEEMIWALGPKESFASDKPDQALKMHSRHGSFEIDLKSARNVKDRPQLKGDFVKMKGAKARDEKKGLVDVKSVVHAVLMILALAAVMPLGALMLSLGAAVRWHALTQGTAMVMVLAGFGLGVATSFTYQRSMGFKSFHQIIGMIVVAFILGQFAIGFLHHKKFKDTQNPTKYGKIHKWLGRIILFLGVLNCFFGLTFALNRRYGVILAGILIFIILSTLAIQLWRRAQYQRRTGTGYPGQQARPQQPWRQPPPAGYTNDPPPGYEPPSQQSELGGLRPASPTRSPSPWRSGGNQGDRKDGYDDDDVPHLGSEQRPRDLV